MPRAPPPPPQTAAVGAGSFTISAPTITGTAAVGSMLQLRSRGLAHPGTLLLRLDAGRDPGRVTGATYWPVRLADLASTLTCTVTSRACGVRRRERVRNLGHRRDPGSFTIGAPTITGGPARVGQQLTCAAPAGTPGTVSYAWTRGVTSFLASTPTYTPTAADLSAALTSAPSRRCVRATPTPTNQATTAQVANGTFTIAPPTITGSPKVGDALTRVAPAGLGTASFEWTRGATSLASTAAYTPVGLPTRARP